MARDRRQLERDLFAAERPQLQPLGAPRALELGQKWSQRMTPMQLVGPVRCKQRQSIAPRVADQEGEEVAGGPIDPVHVLDDQDDQSALRQPREDPIDRLEQLLAPSDRALARSDGWPQRGNRRAQRPLQVGHQLRILDYRPER